MIRSIRPAYRYIYDGLDGKAEILARVFFDEIDFCILTFDAELNNLGDLEIEADPALIATEIVQGEILVIGSSSDEKKIDPDGGDCLVVFVDDGDFKELFAQLVLGHLEAKFFIDFPLNRYDDTTSLSSACGAFLGRVNFSP